VLPFTDTFLLSAVFYTYHSSQRPQWLPFKHIPCHSLFVTIIFQLPHLNLALPWVRSFFIYWNSTLITSGFVQISGTPFGLADSHFHYRIHSYPLRTREIIPAPKRKTIRDSCLGRHVLIFKTFLPPRFHVSCPLCLALFFCACIFFLVLDLSSCWPSGQAFVSYCIHFHSEIFSGLLFFYKCLVLALLAPVTSCYVSIMIFQCSPAWTLSWPRHTHPLNTSKILLASECLFMLLLTQEISSHPHFQIPSSFSLFNLGPTSITKPPELILPCTEFSFL